MNKKYRFARVAVDRHQLIKDAKYQAALDLVNLLEPVPGRCRHYTDAAGVVHTSLYGVIAAMEADLLERVTV